MAALTQTELESEIVEASTSGFEAFCEDISGMFDIEMQCVQQEVSTETVKSLKKRFKKLVAVNIVKAEGALNGSFQLIFDRSGLFTLSGVIVMLPEQRIIENCKRGSEDAAAEQSDAINEAGNMLVGSWDRVFRDELEGHGHLKQTGTFIGLPWNESSETIGLSSDEEVLFIPYEMTIEPYPAFSCGVISRMIYLIVGQPVVTMWLLVWLVFS